MSWVSVHIHLVFATKNRFPYLNSAEVRNKIFHHIYQNAKTKNIWLNKINGYHDHIHCLISLGRDETISKVAQLIKGESSFWINQQKLTLEKFAWQDDYWASGVSESQVPALSAYIDNQYKHHKLKTFEEELNEYYKFSGLKKW